MGDINHDMERLGRIIAADQGLRVSCRGMMAYAKRGEIVIPALDNLDHLGKDAERMMHGYLDHEVGHALDSDFDLFKRAAKDRPSFGDLFNAVEDGYVEARQGKRYRGCQFNLRRKNEWFWERKDEEGQTLPERIADPSLDDWRKFTVSLTMCLRPWGRRNVEDFKAIDLPTYERLSLVRDEMREVNALSETPHASQQCHDISVKIWNKFNRSTPGPNKAPAHLQLDLQGWDDKVAKVMKILRDPESAINKALQSVLDGVDMGAHLDYDGLIKPPDDEGGHNPTPRSSTPYIIFSSEYDHEVDFTGDVSVSDKYETLVSDTREQADALVFAFEAALRSRMAAAASYGHDEGFVDIQALPEFAVGSRTADTIYMQHTAEVDANDVAVSILVDCSGSMGSYANANSPSRLAAQAATALHRACASCDIEHEVLGFTTTYARRAWYDGGRGFNPWVIPEAKAERAREDLLEAQKAGQNVQGFARIYRGGSLSVPHGANLCFPAHAIFKRFGSTDARGISHITGISGNLDGEAVLWAARRLAARREKRRVMFVLSDGYPAGAGNADEHGFLKETVGRCIHAGIEVYGIGIKSDAVHEFYPTYWVADSLADLTSIAMGALTAVLSDKRQEHQCVTL